MAIVNQIKTENWWAELPIAIKLSIKSGLKQSERGETIPHEEVMKRYKKWLKK